jgi:galactoside O-acetyltransferase
MDADCINVSKRRITLEKYTTCLAKSLVLPGVTLEEGSILAANSMATRNLEHWCLYAGSPAKKIKQRENGLLEKARLMEERWK